jgi:hypothetical protein
VLARFTLSYDTTFLALLAMGLAEPEPEIAPGRCPFNPLLRRPTCRENAALAFAADVSALTLHWKLRDDLDDERGARRLLARGGLLLIAGAYRRAAARQPALDQVLCRITREQARLEAAGCANIDQAAEPTAQGLAAILAALSPQEGQRRVLERLGYLLGRFVYLADALDDLEKDRRAGRYNPFLLAGGAAETGQLRQRAKESLYLTAGELQRAWQLLRVRRFSPILENILTLGLMSAANRLAGPAGGEKGAD